MDATPRRLVLAVVVAVLSLAGGVAAYAALTTGKGWWEAHGGSSHFAPDDAIVFPGEPGAAHLHEFFCAETTDAFTTNATLRASDETNCVRGDEEKNPGLARSERSAWWTPALYDNGRLVAANAATVGWGIVVRDDANLVSIPEDLRVIAGPGQRVVNGQQRYQFFCGRGVEAAGDATQAPLCKTDDLRLTVKFPDCWDGVNVDSADHRSHMAYSDEAVCPGSHPFAVPQGELRLRYPTDGGDDVRLSVGTDGGTPTGNISTAHADLVFAWDRADFDRLFEACRDDYCGGANGPVEGH